MRLKNNPDMMPTALREGYTVTDVKIESKVSKTNLFLVSFIVYTNEWSPDIKRINFNMFYPNEFIYLQAIGIDFNEKNTL
jgi:hypothetical protein